MPTTSEMSIELSPVCCRSRASFSSIARIAPTWYEHFAAAGEDDGESQRRRLRAGIMDQEVAQLLEIQPHEPVRRWSP